MADLKRYLEQIGYTNVRTYINSGNVIVESDKSKNDVKTHIETQLPKWFTLDSDLLKVLVVSKDNLSSVIRSKPRNFGEEPSKYHSDVIFLMDIDVDQAFTIFKPKEGVDQIWKGSNVIYSQRLSAERTKSRLNRIIASPLYKSMTIRNWNTTVKLYEMVNEDRAA